jgi:hypothetical protein
VGPNRLKTSSVLLTLNLTDRQSGPIMLNDYVKHYVIVYIFP